MPVPVIGLPFAILTCTITPTIRCNCERGGTVTIVAIQREGGWQRTQDACPSCGRLYAFHGITLDAQGHPLFQIEMSLPVEKRDLVGQ